MSSFLKYVSFLLCSKAIDLIVWIKFTKRGNDGSTWFRWIGEKERQKRQTKEKSF